LEKGRKTPRQPPTLLKLKAQRYCIILRDLLSIREHINTYPLGIERVFALGLYLFCDKYAIFYLSLLAGNV